MRFPPRSRRRFSVDFLGRVAEAMCAAEPHLSDKEFNMFNMTEKIGFTATHCHKRGCLYKEYLQLCRLTSGLPYFFSLRRS